MAASLLLLRQRLDPLAAATIFELAVLGVSLLVAAVILVRRYRSRRELAERAAELDALAGMGRALAASSLEPEELAEVAYEQAARVLKADAFQIGIFEGDAFRALFSIRDMDRNQDTRLPRTGEADGIQAWVRKTGQALLVRDFNAERSTLPGLPAAWSADPVASGVFVPLIAGEEAFGIVSVQSRRRRAFRDHHVRLLTILANAVASALAMTSLQAEVKFHLLQWALIREISHQMTSLQPLPGLMARVVSLIHETYPTYTVRLFERDEDSLLLRAASDGTASTEAPEDEARPATEGDAVSLAGQDGSLVVRRAGLGVMEAPQPGDSGGITEMAVPLRVEDRVLGVLHIAVEGGQTIPPEHVDLAEMLAAQLAMAILESRNFAQQQEEAWVTTVLLEVARHAARPGDAEDALQAVLQLTTLLAGTRWAILLLTDPQQGALRLGPLAGLGRRLQAEHTDLRISPEEIGLRPPYLESDRPYPITLPAHLAEHFDNTVLASGLVLSDGTSLLGVLLVEGQEFIGRRPALLAGIGHQISLRLENTHLIETIAARRSLEREVAMARSIQESFLPKSPPSHPGWQIGTTWQVAREVGGDFYDFIPLAPGPDGVRWGIAIADVADKGVPAALFMALCRTLLRSVAISRIDPGITLTRLNELIFADTQSDMFVSVFYGVWEPEAGRLTYANGGHNPPLLFLPEQPARMLTEHEMVLGVGQDVTYSTHSIRLAPGALLVLYTDGVTEAMDGTGDLFGVHRLENLVRGMNEWDAQSVANHITRRVLDFCADPDLPDDLTAVVLRRSE